MFSFYRMSTLTKLLKIGTLQYNPYIYCRFQTEFSPQIIILILCHNLRYIQKEKQHIKITI